MQKIFKLYIYIIFYWGANPVAIRLGDDRSLLLSALGGRARESRFDAAPDGTWRGTENYYRNEILRVVRRPDGSISHLDIGSFVFTRAPYDPDAPIPGGVDDRGWR